MLQTSVRGCNGCDAEIRSQTGEFPSVARLGYQGVAIFPIQVRQGPRDIADVGADSEVANPADIDDDMQRHRIPWPRRGPWPPRVFTGPLPPRVSRHTAETAR